MTLGERVNDLRRARGWTQRTLAQATGIHYTHIYRIETDQKNSTLRLIFRLAQGFGITMSELLEGVDEA